MAKDMPTEAHNKEGKGGLKKYPRAEYMEIEVNSNKHEINTKWREESGAIVMKEVFRRYRARLSGETPVKKPSRSRHDWLPLPFFTHAVSRFSD